MTDAVAQRFAQAQESNPKLVVDLPAINRALIDYADLPDLEGHAIDCAEWLASQTRKRAAAPTLRRWLRDKRDLGKGAGTPYRGDDQRLGDWIGWCKRRLPTADPKAIEAIVRAEYEAGRGCISIPDVAKKARL